MKKITFIGAGSTIFAKNVLGDCLLTEALNGFEFALYDIDPKRLQESQLMLENLRDRYNPSVAINSYDDRKLALQNAGYVINAIQVGGYKPSTVIDFEIPKRYGCARRSPIQSASAGYSDLSEQSRSYLISQKIWRKCALTHGS